MARTKRPPSRSPLSIGDAHRDMFRGLTSSDRRLLRIADPEETSLTLNWFSIEQKSRARQKKQRLQAARQVLRRHRAGQDVDQSELTFAQEILEAADRERRQEIARKRAAAAAIAAQAQANRRPVPQTQVCIMIPDVLNSSSLPTIAPSVAIKRDATTKTRSKINPAMKTTPKNPLTMSNENQRPSSPARPTRAALDPSRNDSEFTGLDELENRITTPEAAAKRKALLRALKALRYDTHADDLPAWISGLPKPRPQARLSAEQNEHVVAHWRAERDRLVTLRAALPLPAADDAPAEWRYERFPTPHTRVVRKRTATSEKSGKGDKMAVARGTWTLWVGGVEREGERRLDENPRTARGEAMGWVEAKRGGLGRVVGDGWGVERILEELMKL